MSGKNKISMLLSVVLLALSLVLAFGVKYVFHSCPVSMEKGAVFATGITLAVMSLLLFLVKNAGERAAVSAAMIPVTVMAMLFPQVIIRICMMPNMMCRTTMRPAVIGVCVALLVVELVNVLISKKEAKSEK